MTMKSLMTGVKGDVEMNFVKLKELVAIHIPGQDANRYLEMMNGIAEDVSLPNDVLYLGFKRAPAAKGNHHAFEGGLVYHLLEMWSVWEYLREDTEFGQYVNNERVLKAIIHHDLHKAFRTYKLIGEEPWATEYGDDPTDMLMITDVKSMWILMNYGIKLDPEQMNALQWAEGGFASIRPKHCSVLSKLCYLLDEMSGNVIGRIDAKTLIDHRKPIV